MMGYDLYNKRLLKIPSFVQSLPVADRFILGSNFNPPEANESSKYLIGIPMVKNLAFPDLRQNRAFFKVLNNSSYLK